MNANISIPNHSDMRRLIRESHVRSMEYGVCREERSPDQKKLTPEELETQRALSSDLMGVASEYIDEFYEILSPNLFMIGVVDKEGYILQVSGSDTIKATFNERNCAPGYRFTEKDVGTTAISLCLKEKVSIQLNDKDHFCIRAHGFTSSAAPILGQDDALQGVLVVSGKSNLVHPHTLIMVTSAARSIEKQIRLLRRNREMSVYASFLKNVLESAETGLLAVDNDQLIWKANRKAKEILGQDNLDGKPISILKGLELDLDDIYTHPDSWKMKECQIQQRKQTIHLIYSAQPVISEHNRQLGAVIVFEEFGNIRKIADKISGSNAYFTFDHLVGDSRVFRESVKLAKRAARSRSTVLLMGETGTGKELFAQAIHNDSAFSRKPFIPINCGAIPGELMESELFGYVDGAFSGASKGGRPGKFEMANGGTILLDEIGDMPHNMQVKLLRVLQTGEVQRVGDRKVVKVDTRIIASTNVNLPQAVDQQRFRQDLYYRLNILPITIPPLRERGAGDIHALATYFMRKYNPRCRLTPDALEALASYDWPGNVRELENVIIRAIHACDGVSLSAEFLCLPLKRVVPMTPPAGSLREMEKRMISTILQTKNFNMAETAKVLGISRATLYRKVKSYDLSPDGF